MKRIIVVLTLLISFLVSPVIAADVSKMDKEELKKHLGSADLIVLDVRTGNDWTSSDHKIVGAVRENPKHVDNWIDNYDKSKTVVLYCS